MLGRHHARAEAEGMQGGRQLASPGAAAPLPYPCLPALPAPLPDPMPPPLPALTPAWRQVEGFLEELLLLCQRSEEYTQFLLARMAEVAAPAPLPPARETALRGGAFNSAVGV